DHAHPVQRVSLRTQLRPHRAGRQHAGHGDHPRRRHQVRRHRGAARGRRGHPRLPRRCHRRERSALRRPRAPPDPGRAPVPERSASPRPGPRPGHRIRGEL
ncbi:MAG: Flagellar protein FlbD, partial [uncultured Nocardioidaceae bacterium]